MFDAGKWVSKRKLMNKTELSVLPSVYTRTMEGIITHVEHCNKFWFQPLNEVNEQTLTTIQSTLNTQRLKAFDKPADINIDQLVAAPYSDESCGELYFRARVLEALVEAHDNVLFFVQFIDYGNFDHIPFQKLRMLENLKNDVGDIPPRSFECKLCEIEPSMIDATRGRWTKNAVQRFVALTKNKALKVDVYSVVDNVAAVTLFSDSLNINRKLISNAYAMAGEESYMSKVDHDLRIRSQRDYCGNVLIADDNAQIMVGDNEIAMPEVEPPPDQECRIKVKLLGPHSPLDTKLTSLMAAMAQSTIRIESESVNSILLDTDPQDSHPRLVVATSISGNANGGGLTIRQTTVMPNIHGFAPLMALIFCPKMEARRDKTKSRYVSFMTGLGCHPESKKALFPEHDVVFDLDVDIQNEDLQIVSGQVVFRV
jgi:ATP-dependent RNA helicase TDRD9